mmetsp:Transcript_12602/g.26685  ORF Transcript_12602/g.26685 Transcript_12602/m.26685 type:complete len:487 (-) Transcript_12602:455-1915(-)|eukprot:CAMPEP_0201119528 /NCGR_PEP_ID=MMETSP0850-20130426/3643_1 /ASSEMBLY_ACC=CAM_ASM_000622 /TAXON_ID=183588 /ORGANISM="Pseudo-nitzschia fraudulenta, Strain WWA7" /LENGTH=486 /DNA_ID=CAMNT_0047385257 /DNA_START=477 /DNA_END=1937 /DNA_ORIENTATION=-
METAATTADNNINNAVDTINGNLSYTTDSQSVQSGVTHGTPHSPARTSATPLSLSPSSHSNNVNSVKKKIPDKKMGTMEGMPQYRQQPDFGMRQVEWQVLDQQQDQHALNNTYQQNRQRSNPASDDDETEPSSSATTRENNAMNANNNNMTGAKGYPRSDSATGATSTFGRLVKPSTKSANNRNHDTNPDRKESADEEGVIEGVLIYGYLQKLNRNGKWQTRWFETDGECLTYFKSSKRVKLLASLDLAKVGSIVVNNEDENGCCFTINIAKRPYHLRADSKTAMKDWVITLNRVKEARMQEGNVKLFIPKDFQNNHNQPPIDLLDDQEFTTPRVVVVANRQRTHAVEDDDFHSWEASGTMDENNPFKDITSTGTAPSIARWQKPTTSITHLAGKVLRWARSIRKYHCSAETENQVVIINQNMSAQPSTIAATQSTSTSHSPNSAVNVVPTADLLDTGGIVSNTNNQIKAVEDDDDDDENAARFLS